MNSEVKTQVKHVYLFVLLVLEVSCSWSRLQLMKQPQGRWIQRSDNMKRGVTAGASRVRKKLRVSREELWASSA